MLYIYASKCLLAMFLFFVEVLDIVNLCCVRPTNDSRHKCKQRYATDDIVLLVKLEAYKKTWEYMNSGPNRNRELKGE